jgi:diketogulonate reductase-like aldo/keto reductase
MEYREFGKTGTKVSLIGMGTYYDIQFILTAKLFKYQIDKESKILAIRKGIELGINLIDTAEIYETETIVAKAIKGFKRDELFIATKVWPSHLRYDDVLKAAEKSLLKLQCSYIDLYQIHWPNRKVPIKETMKAMERLVEIGIIRYIGISNFSLEQTIKAQEALSKYELVSTQVEYSLMKRDIEKDILPYCEKNKIAILAYRPLAHGKLAKPKGRLKVVMEKISKKYKGKTPAQIAQNWLVNKSNVVFSIPRASRPQRIIENAGAVNWSLEKDDMMKLEQAV